MNSYKSKLIAAFGIAGIAGGLGGCGSTSGLNLSGANVGGVGLSSLGTRHFAATPSNGCNEFHSFDVLVVAHAKSEFNPECALMNDSDARLKAVGYTNILKRRPDIAESDATVRYSLEHPKTVSFRTVSAPGGKVMLVPDQPVITLNRGPQ